MRRSMHAYNTVSLSAGPIPFLVYSLALVLPLSLYGVVSRFFYNPPTSATETVVNFVPFPLPKKTHPKTTTVSRVNTTNFIQPFIATVDEKIPKDHNEPMRSGR